MASNAEGARLARSTRRWRRSPATRGSEFGLHVVAPAIQDDAAQPHPFRDRHAPAAPPAPQASGHDCTSLVVSVTNRPGAVHDMLVPLKTHGVSMTALRVPTRALGPVGVLLLHRHQGHPDEPRVAAALRELREACAFFKVLGTYPIDVH